MEFDEMTREEQELQALPEETPTAMPEPEPTQEAEIDYEAEIQRLKAAYKEKRRAERQQKVTPQEPKAKCGWGRVFLGVLLSVSIVFFLLTFIVGALALYPSPERSFAAKVISKYVAVVQDPYPEQNDVQIGGETVKPSDNVNIQVNGDISASAVYAKASKSVVGIEVRQMVSTTPWSQATETVVSQGSGVIYSVDGLILTNHHVIQAALGRTQNTIDSDYKIVVYFNTDLTEYYTVTEIVGYDADNDLALIRVNAKGLTPAKFADVGSLEVGQPVIAIGSPGGLQFMNSVSEGIVSGLDRDITSENTTVYELIQITAAINPGNSGGALLNAEGDLIGICVIKIVSESYEGMGFAIHVDTVSRIVDSFIEHGKYVKPVLGVEVDTRYTPEEAGEQKWPTGAYVANVTAGSCAQEAGIRPKDIICEVGGEKIVKFSQLRKFLLRHNPGDSVVIKVFRTTTGEYLDLTVVLHASE